ncbi:MAG TPA: hypothetical protein VF624_07510, partial [Tepidisphaeraceae bacterium]
ACNASKADMLHQETAAISGSSHQLEPVTAAATSAAGTLAGRLPASLLATRDERATASGTSVSGSGLQRNEARFRYKTIAGASMTSPISTFAPAH